MKTQIKPLSLAILAAMAPCQLWAEQASSEVLDEVLVFGEPGKTDSATKLDLTIFETPQSVFALSRLQLDEFALNSVNQALDYTPGVTVERIETGRTYYTARGFDIVNFQYDGVGIPFAYGNADGVLDTAIFEKVEVVKGAAGLITGLANPSATINFVRKRPTDELMASARLSLNEYGGYRLDADASNALSDTVRARVVVATEDSETYLDRHNNQIDVVYGVLEADFGENTLLTLGHSYSKNRIDGVMWGALPLLYSDNSRANYVVSANTAPDWTFGENVYNQSFVELKHQVNDSWSLNAVYNHTEIDADSGLFYVSGKPDPVTELGLYGTPGFFKGGERHEVLDLFASGQVELGGQQHDLVVGINYVETKTDQSAAYPAGGFITTDWMVGDTPRPTVPAYSLGADVEQRHKAFYAAANWRLGDDWSLLTGARHLKVEQEGVNYGSPAKTTAEETVPYVGLTYQVADNTLLYSSYSEVFTQQTWVDADYKPLGATQGDSAEVGIKQSFNDGKAVMTFALFQAEQANFGVYVERDDNNVAVYAPTAFDTTGFEIEFNGEVSPGFNLSAGFTQLDHEGKGGSNPRPFIAERSVKLASSYRLPNLEALTLSVGAKWQDDISTASGFVDQGAYALIDLTASYKVSQNVSVAAKIDNLTDKQYLNSLYWEQAFYGKPRTISASISWKY